MDKFDDRSSVFVERAVNQACAFEVDGAENGICPFIALTDQIRQGLEVKLVT
jgi:hypothetical protein